MWARSVSAAARRPAAKTPVDEVPTRARRWWFSGGALVVREYRTTRASTASAVEIERGVRARVHVDGPSVRIPGPGAAERSRCGPGGGHKPGDPMTDVLHRSAHVRGSLGVCVYVCRVGLSPELDRVSGQAGTGDRGLENTSGAQCESPLRARQFEDGEAGGWATRRSVAIAGAWRSQGEI